MALLAPLAAAALVMLVAALRGLALPWASAGLTLVGNVLPGFAAACAVRTRTGEPGAAADTAVVLVLLAPSLVPQVARWVPAFPAPSSDGASDHVRWIVLAMCTAVIAISIGGRSAPRWMSRFCDPAVDHQMTPIRRHHRRRPSSTNSLVRVIGIM